MSRAILYHQDGRVTVESIADEDLHDFVGGYLEGVNLGGGLHLLCNEDGIRLKLPPNPTVGPFGQILGQYLVVRVGPDGENVDVTEADVARIVGASK